MAGGTGWSKNGIGKLRRSRSRASTPSRFLRCRKIQCAGFSEKRPSRVLPTMTEMTVMLLILAVAERKKLAHRRRLSPRAGSAERPAHAVRVRTAGSILPRQPRGRWRLAVYSIRLYYSDGLFGKGDECEDQKWGRSTPS